MSLGHEEVVMATLSIRMALFRTGLVFGAIMVIPLPHCHIGRASNAFKTSRPRLERIQGSQSKKKKRRFINMGPCSLAAGNPRS